LRIALPHARMRNCKRNSVRPEPVWLRIVSFLFSDDSPTGKPDWGVFECNRDFANNYDATFSTRMSGGICRLFEPKLVQHCDAY